MDVTVPDFLSPAEFSHLSGFSLATIRRRIADGTLPFLQPGGKRTAVRIPRSVLSSPVTTTAGVSAPAAKTSHSPARRPNWMRR